MEEKKTVFDYLSQLFATFGVIVLIFIVMSALIGEGTGDYSSLFTYGQKALALPTLLQLLLLAGVITASQVVFLTDRFIRNMSIVLRYVLFFLLIMISMILMTVIFSWFPVNDPKAWAGFFISFAISMFVSIFLMRLEERMENEKMQEALKKFNKS